MEQQPLLPEVLTEEMARDALGRLAQVPNLGRGRPRGALADAYKVCRKILAMESPGLLRLTIAAAKDGNWLAMKMCLDRGIPVPRSAPIDFDIDMSDPQRAIDTTIEQVAAGELAPDDGQAVTSMIKDSITARSIGLFGGAAAPAASDADPRVTVMDRLAKLRDDRQRRAEQPPGNAA